MPELSPERIAEIKRLAEAARPEDWWDFETFRYDFSTEDAAHIAACDPPTILTLIAMVEERDALRDALTAMRAWLGVMADAMDWDVGETCVTINAVGPNGKRELAKLSLAEINAQAFDALSTTGDT